MADWFKIESNFLDGPRVRYCTNKEPLSISVLLWCFSQCCREKADRFAWSNIAPEIEGLGLVLNIEPGTVRTALQLLTAASLISFENNFLIVACWADHQSEYLSRKGYFADRYRKLHGEARSNTVKPVNSGVPLLEENRGEEKIGEERTLTPTPSAGAEPVKSVRKEPEEPEAEKPLAPPAMSRGRKPRDVAECLTKASFIGMTDQDARDWYRDCEANDWKRGDGTPFDAWPKQMTMHRDKLAERRARAGNGNGGGDLTGPQLILRQTELKRVEERIQKMISSVDSHRDLNDKDKEIVRELRLRKKELLALLGLKV